MKKKGVIRSHGRSLVELMIAMAIGLVIMAAISALYLSNSKSYRVTDDKAHLEEDGRLALNLIAFHLRMAGYGELISGNPWKDQEANGTTFEQAAAAAGGILEGVEGCTGGFTNPSNVAVACKNTAGADGIVIRYYVDSFNANQTAANVPADCLGQGVITTPAIVESRFFIALNPSTGFSELYCVGNGGTAVGAPTFANPPQPIAENVIDMRITYGYDSDGDQSVDGFYTAQKIGDNTLPVVNDGHHTRWGQVASANVCLVVRSANDNLTSDFQRYRDCMGNLVTATDRRLYSTFSTVVALRSRVSGGAL
ncbi:MAG: PilW family protein [Burkholderiales bacterium]|nr:PilW family protein [Burkholderiales bacterium]